MTTTKKNRGRPNFRRPASPPRWRRRGTTSCWAAARRCAAPWDALHVPGGGAVVAAHKIAAVVALGHSSLLSSLAAAAGARHLPTSEISLFPPFAEIREIIPEMAFSRGILPPAGAAQTPLQQGVLAPKPSWRPNLFLATAQKHCGKPQKN